MPDRTLITAAAGWLAVALVAALVAALGPQHERPAGAETKAEKLAEAADVGGPFPLELRTPQIAAGTSQRVLVELRRPSVAELMDDGKLRAADQRANVRSLRREARALMSALTAKGVSFGHPVVFARVWAGFAATIATKDLPSVQQLGLRIEPARRFYPAQVAAPDAPEVRPLPTKAAGADVAVIDVFPRVPEPGLEVLADTAGGQPRRRIAPAERAGPKLAAIVRAALPRANVAAIRVGGSQPLETGRYGVFTTTDQLLAGLERAVDRDADGDSEDAAPVALTGVSAPYSGFARAPEAIAADGAAALGTLVVAPTGNGGESQGPFGTIGSPAAAGRALAVGALDGSGDPAPASSRGPTYAWSPKPDLAIGGGAKEAGWGTAVAAARVAGVAAALRSERPALTASQAAAALVGTAAPRGSLYEAGGGDPLLQAARVTTIVAEPWSLVLRPGTTSRVRITNLTGAAVAVPLRTDVQSSLRFSPAVLRVKAHDSALLRIRVPKDAPANQGRIVAGPIGIPFAIAQGDPPAPPIGALEIVRSKRRATGVRFTAGSIDRADDGADVVPVGKLVLVVLGPTRLELTPPGGARDLLPGEYAYTLTPDVLRSLERGRYRFVVRARGTAGGAAVVRRSAAFSIR